MTSTVTKLRAAPPRTPERQALAAAIARHTEASAKLAAYDRALTDYGALGAAEARVAEAERQVEEAKSNAAAFLAAQALGSAPTAPQSIKGARAALEAARDDLEALNAARDALRAQRADAEAELRRAEYALNDRIKAVVRASGAPSRLIARFKAAQQEIAAVREEIGGVFRCFEGAETLWDGEREYPPSGAGDAWRSAMRALASDADALLPGEESPTPDAA